MIVAYLLGSIPFGYLVVKLASGADIRETGSGGTGATNVFTFCQTSAGLWRVKGPIGVASSYTCPSGNNADLVAEAVTGLGFAYFDVNNNPIPNPPTGPFSLDGQGLAAVPSFVTTTNRVAVRRIVIARVAAPPLSRPWNETSGFAKAVPAAASQTAHRRVPKVRMRRCSDSVGGEARL